MKRSKKVADDVAETSRIRTQQRRALDTLVSVAEGLQVMTGLALNEQAMWLIYWAHRLEGAESLRGASELPAAVRKSLRELSPKSNLDMACDVAKHEPEETVENHFQQLHQLGADYDLDFRIPFMEKKK